MSSDDIQEKVVAFISKQFRIPKDDIDTTESLVDQGVVDSFGFVEIAMFVEQTFAVAIPDEQVNAENFGTIVAIIRCVESALAYA